MSLTQTPPLQEDSVRNAVQELLRIFKHTPSKQEAHQRSRAVLEDLSRDERFLTAVLRAYLSDPNALNQKNYPVVGMEVELNPYFHLVVNCWIPLPDKRNDLSTKAIHHHGDMLLTTVTVFGPGYEHWLFTKPQQIDPQRHLYTMQVVERKRHAKSQVSFVDAQIPHLPVYPNQLSITLCLWSSRHPTTWLDYVKRIPWLKRRAGFLREMASCLGLSRSLDLKVVQYFDFYPTNDGFQAMADRIEYTRGPNEDHLHSVFHVVQQTGNENLLPLIERQLQSQPLALANPGLIQYLVDQTRKGLPVEGRLSACHLNVPHALFPTQSIEQTLARLQNQEPEPMTQTGVIHGR